MGMVHRNFDVATFYRNSTVTLFFPQLISLCWKSARVPSCLRRTCPSSPSPGPPSPPPLAGRRTRRGSGRANPRDPYPGPSRKKDLFFSTEKNLQYSLTPQKHCCSLLAFFIYIGSTVLQFGLVTPGNSSSYLRSIWNYFPNNLLGVFC